MRDCRALWRSLAVLAVLAASTPASAAWLSVTSRTLYQGSQIRLFPDRNEDRFRNLNRFAQWLDVGGFAFGPGDDLDAVISLRYRTDFGTGFHRDTPEGLGVPAVDGRDQLELLYAFVDWRDVIEDTLDLRLGRQLLIDDLDWFSLDGLNVTYHLFENTRISVYVGRPVPYEAFLSSEPFLYDGTELDDGFDLTFGGQATFGAGDFNASLSYRHSFLFRGTDDLVIFGRPGLSGAALDAEIAAIRQVTGGSRGVPEASVGATIGYTLRRIDLDLYLHGNYNLILGGFEQARGGLAWTPSQSVRVQTEFLRVHPRFAADSIFNYFNIHPYDRARAEVATQIVPGVWATAGYFFQKFYGEAKGPKSLASSGSPDDNLRGGEGEEFQGSDVAHGPRGELSYRKERWGIGVSAEASTNFGGRYAYGGNYRQFEVFTDGTILDDRLNLGLRFNYTGAQTDWFPGLNSGAVAPEVVSFGLILSSAFRVTDMILARLDLIKNFESVIEGSYRLQSMLEVRYP